MIALRYETSEWFPGEYFPEYYEDYSFENFVMSIPKDCLYYLYLVHPNSLGYNDIHLHYAHEEEVTLYAWVDICGALVEISAPINYTGKEHDRRNPETAHSARLEKFSEEILRSRKSWINFNIKSLNPGTAFNVRMTIDLFESHLGRPISEILPAAQKIVDSINLAKAERTRMYSKMMLENKELLENIIGIDRKVERFNTGYRITVLMRALKSYEEQLSFVKANKRLVLKYAIIEARTTQSGKKIEPKFYQVTSMVLSRHNELYITLELKESIIEALTEGGGK